MYIHLSLHEENVHRQVGVFPHEKKIPYGDMIFKKSFKSNRFQVVVWSQHLRFSYFSFLKEFPAKKWLVLHFQSLIVKVKKVKKSEKVKKVIPFWSFIFPETYIVYIMYILLLL